MFSENIVNDLVFDNTSLLSTELNLLFYGLILIWLIWIFVKFRPNNSFSQDSPESEISFFLEDNEEQAENTNHFGYWLLVWW